MADTTKAGSAKQDMAKRFQERQAMRHAEGKGQSDFFVAVRERGTLNTLMSAPAAEFERRNPGMGTKWEYAPLNGDNLMVTQREIQGWRVVQSKEVTDNSEAVGQVRRGDMILMAAPKDLINDLALSDALAAHEAAKLPETEYKDYVRGIRVKLKDGTVQEGRPVGSIRVTEEARDLTPSAEEEVETKAQE